MVTENKILGIPFTCAKTTGSYKFNCNSALKYNSVGYNKILPYKKNLYILYHFLAACKSTNLYAVKHSCKFTILHKW